MPEMDLLSRLITTRHCRVFLLILILVGVALISFKFAGVADGNRIFQRSFHSQERLGVVEKPCPANKYREDFRALLAHWHRLATHYGIAYVIEMGSLLGQYRNGDVIPWDGDVDVLVNGDDFDIVKKLSQKRNFRQDTDREFHLVVHPEFRTKVEDDRQRWNCKGKKVQKQIDSCSFIQPLGRLIYGSKHVDIFHFTRVGGLLDVPDIGKQYNISDYYPFTRCKFMDISTWCPNNPKKVLEVRYGDLTEELVCADGKWQVGNGGRNK